MIKFLRKKLTKLGENVDKQEVFNASISEMIKKLEIEENSDYEEIDNKKEDDSNREVNNKDDLIKKGSPNLMKIKKWQ